MNKTIILNPMTTARPCTTTEEMLKNALGGNTGNVLFVESLKEQFNYSEEIGVHLPNALEMASKLSSNTVVVIPSSNFIIHGVNSDTFYNNFLNFISKNDCPITMIGLGAQACRKFNTAKKLVRFGLSRLQLDFFRRMAERAVTLGVRGEFTAECLDLMGIHNYRIIGCPSFYRYFDGHYPILPPPLTNKTVMTFTPGSLAKTRLFDLGMANKSIWVLQSLREIPQIGMGGGILLKWRLRSLLGNFKSSQSIMDYYNKYSKVFFSLASWDEFYQKGNIGFVYGTRFHGNMIALRNRVPALWLKHDNRTNELTKLLHLPSIDIGKLKSIRSLKELIEYCDYSEVLKHYSELLRNYVDFLNENNINHKYTI